MAAQLDSPTTPVPKHIIFLSHSGQEKPFVQQLYKDLERAKLFPFFDQNPDSLPVGEKFPPLILDAAKKCRVAVVVLSPGYLESKWPMLELLKIHNSIKEGNRVTIITLFYKLKPDDLREATHRNPKQSAGNKLIIPKDKTNIPSKKSEAPKKEEAKERWEKWKEGWRALGLDVKLCEDAIKELKSTNGMVFTTGNSEPEYREKVVMAVYKQSPSTFSYDTSEIRGCDRLCKVISDMFVDKEGTKFLGLHGDAGSGKTICCEAMCSYFQDKFQGRVSHVELDFDTNSMSARKKKEERLSRVLKDLFPTDLKLPAISYERQLKEYLKKELRSKSVFLVVDNVSQSSRDEAEFYVNAIKFAKDSKVLVTSRNPEILEAILKDKKFVHPIPGLEKHEASELILKKAASGLTRPLEPTEEEIVEKCIARGRTGQYYSPLMLQSLATSLQKSAENKIRKWKPIVERVRQNDTNSLQLREYEKLDKTSKLVFLDLAIFADTLALSHEDFHDWRDYKSFDKVVTRIALLHGVSLAQAKMKVEKLLSTPVVDWQGHPVHGRRKVWTVWVPQDYVTFARWLIKRTGNREEKNWCMACSPERDDEDESKPDDEAKSDDEAESDDEAKSNDEAKSVDEAEPEDESIPEAESVESDNSKAENTEFADLDNGSDLSKLVRVSISRLSLAYRDHAKIQQWRFVACLELIQVSYLPRLDLHGLHSLRVLTVEECEDLERIECTCESSFMPKDGSDPPSCFEDEAPRSGCMPNLRYVQLWYLPRLKCASFTVHCWSLETLWFFVCANLKKLPDLRYCKKLKKLRLPCGDFEGFQGLSCNRALTELAFHWDPETVRNFTEGMRLTLLGEIMNLENLRVLDIVDERQVFDWIPAGFQRLNVTKLAHLTFLDLSYATSIEEVEGLEWLSELKSLGLYGCSNLRVLPDLDAFEHLEKLCIGHCHNLDLVDVDELPWYFVDFHESGESCSFGEHECLDPYEQEGRCKMCTSPNAPEVPSLQQAPQVQASQAQITDEGVNDGGWAPIDEASYSGGNGDRGGKDDEGIEQILHGWELWRS